MSIRVVFSLGISISETTTELKELGNTPPWQGTNDQLDEGGTFRVRIPAGTSNVSVSMLNLTNVRLLGIKTTKTVHMSKNSAAGEPWTIRPLGVGAVDGVFVTTTDGITGLYFSNSGSLDADVTISIGGLV